MDTKKNKKQKTSTSITLCKKKKIISRILMVYFENVFYAEHDAVIWFSLARHTFEVNNLLM